MRLFSVVFSLLLWWGSALPELASGKVDRFVAVDAAVGVARLLQVPKAVAALESGNSSALDFERSPVAHEHAPAAERFRRDPDGLSCPKLLSNVSIASFESPLRAQLVAPFRFSHIGAPDSSPVDDALDTRPVETRLVLAYNYTAHHNSSSLLRGLQSCPAGYNCRGSDNRCYTYNCGGYCSMARCCSGCLSGSTCYTYTCGGYCQNTPCCSGCRASDGRCYTYTCGSTCQNTPCCSGCSGTDGRCYTYNCRGTCQNTPCCTGCTGSDGRCYTYTCGGTCQNTPCCSGCLSGSTCYTYTCAGGYCQYTPCCSGCSGTDGRWVLHVHMRRHVPKHAVLKPIQLAVLRLPWHRRAVLHVHVREYLPKHTVRNGPVEHTVQRLQRQRRAVLHVHVRKYVSKHAVLKPIQLAVLWLPWRGWAVLHLHMRRLVPEHALHANTNQVPAALHRLPGR